MKNQHTSKTKLFFQKAFSAALIVLSVVGPFAPSAAYAQSVVYDNYLTLGEYSDGPEIVDCTFEFQDGHVVDFHELSGPPSYYPIGQGYITNYHCSTQGDTNYFELLTQCSVGSPYSNGSCNTPPPVTPSAPTFTSALAANPSVLGPGATSSLSWATSDATSCVASGGWSGSQATSGTQSVGPITADTTYTLTCTGPGGNAASSATITFNPGNGGPTDQIPFGTFTNASCSALTGWAYDTDTINAPVAVHLYKDGPAGTGTFVMGATANLPDSALNLVARITGDHGFSIPTPDSLKDGVAHTLYIYGINTNAAGQNFLLVGSPMTITCQPTVTPTAPVFTTGLRATPSTIGPGATSTLSWATTGATTCVASGGWSGNQPASGAAVVGPISANTTYTLACSGPGGTATSSATITYNPGGSNPVDAPPDAIFDSATCASLEGWAYDADTSSTSIAVHLYKDGPAGTGTFVMGATANGSRPDVDTFFGITGNHGFSIPTPASLKDGVAHSLYVYAINSNPNGINFLASQSPLSITCQPTGVAAPVFTTALTANPTTLVAGATSVLTWATTGATTCTASGGWSGAQSTSGIATVGPISANTTYTLACSGPGGTATSSATITFNPGNGGPTDQPPIGILDSAMCTGTINGWAYDPDNSSGSISVDLYSDVLAGPGVTPFAQVTANGVRPDVDTHENITGNHGFIINTPNSLKDGANHRIYAYGINSNPAGQNHLLDSPVPVIMSGCTAGSVGNSAPTGLVISGPTAGTTDTSYAFTASATDPEGTVLSFGFDWENDGTIDATNYAIPSGAQTSMSHSWSTNGTYTIRVVATDAGGMTVSGTHDIVITSGGGGSGGSSSGGGGGGGGSSNTGGHHHDIPPGVITLVTTTTPVAPSEASAGICKYSDFITQYMKKGIENNPNEVKKLQYFLTTYEDIPTPVTGVFDDATEASVNKFQLRYTDDILAPWGTTTPTGIVYITTSRKINTIFCGANPEYRGNGDLKDINFSSSVLDNATSTEPFTGDVGLNVATTSTSSNIAGVFGAIFGPLADFLKDIPLYALLIALLLLLGSSYIVESIILKDKNKEYSSSLMNGLGIFSIGTVLNVLNTLSFMMNSPWFTSKVGLAENWILGLDAFNLILVAGLSLYALLMAYFKSSRDDTTFLK